jgi:2-polyprenyl-3-methyl-5-hydroxy-6-metoxy-1,4-benzoquinol methylase
MAFLLCRQKVKKQRTYVMNASFKEREATFLSRKEHKKTEPRPSKPSFFFEFEKFYAPSHMPSSVLNFLFNDRLRRIIKMMDFPSNKEYVILDEGCYRGYFTIYLAQRLSGIVIGTDVTRNNLHEAKIKARLRTCDEKNISRGTVEFVCSDINHLPFRKDSIDVVVSASVLEHLNDLEGAIEEIKNSMRNGGCLIAGYPIETNLFKFLLKLFFPVGLTVRDPRIWGKEKFDRSPDTHKQSFTTIRCLLQKYFLRVQREKSFFAILPDQLSWYESVRMIKKSEVQLKAYAIHYKAGCAEKP